MSLMFYDPFRTSRYRDPRFGSLVDPEELIAPLVPREFRQLLDYRPNFSNLLSNIDTGDQVRFDKDKFNVNVDVQQFKPDEISVRVTDDNTITVEGKHEERPDEHGYISRQFVRRYVLPKGHDVSKVESKLSSDGVLTITAPRIEDSRSHERVIPIKHTGQPSKAIEQGKK